MDDKPQVWNGSGTKTVIAVPFEGDAGFFSIQPTTFTMNPPRGMIVKNEMWSACLTITAPKPLRGLKQKAAIYPR